MLLSGLLGWLRCPEPSGRAPTGEAGVLAEDAEGADSYVAAAEGVQSRRCVSPGAPGSGCEPPPPLAHSDASPVPSRWASSSGGGEVYIHYTMRHKGDNSLLPLVCEVADEHPCAPERRRPSEKGDPPPPAQENEIKPEDSSPPSVPPTQTEALVGNRKRHMTNQHGVNPAISRMANRALFSVPPT